MRYQPQALSCKMGSNMREVHNSQAGIVAIFSVMIIMGLLTLIALGFTAIARTAQRNTTDSQFSTQAYYAAESGVNDAIRALGIDSTLNKTDCQGADPTDSFEYDYADNIGVGYTCVLVNPTIDNQEFGTVPVAGVGQAVVTPINTNGVPITRFEFDWDSPAPTDPIPATSFNGTNPNFPSAADWGNQVGILRIDLVPITAGVNRDQLANNAYTFLLYPTTTGAGSATVSNVSMDVKGTVIEGNCGGAAPRRCSAEITVGGASSSHYILRMQSYYNAVTVVERVYGVASNPITQYGAQALIDATGHSNDVYRRIQVRVPVSQRREYRNQYSEAFSILSADSICKRMFTYTGNTSVSGVTPPYAGTPCDIL